MNRLDEIQGLARDIASNVHADPDARDAMADDLIKLCGAMIGAVGKVVAVEGETATSEADDPGDFTKAHNRYLVGELVQDGAREVVEQSTNPNVELERWTRPSPGDPCRCGHVPSVHRFGTGRCSGEQYNHEQCRGGQCTGFVRREPSGGWRHVDRRPAALRRSGPVTVVVPDAATPGAPIELGNPEPVNLDGFGATPVAVSQPARPCCYAATGPCATCRNGGPVGGCCYPLRDVCPSHH